MTEVRTPAGSSTATTSTFTYPTTSNLLTNVKQGTTVTRAFVYDAAGNTTKHAGQHGLRLCDQRREPLRS